MRYVRVAVLALLTSVGVACSALTEPTTHRDTSCSGGGTSEWTKCAADSTHP